MADSKLFQAAGLFRDRGLSVLPCRLFFDEKGKCKKPPLIKEWLSLQKKQVSKLEFMKWKNLFRDEPGRGIGIITGEVSDLLVVDIDSEEAMEGIKHLLEGVTTVTVKTPGGWHYYFKYRPGFGNNVGIDPSSGLDIRAEGGYVIAPPSLYPDGRPYQFFSGRMFVDKSSVSPMPEALFDHMTKLIQTKKGKKAGHGGAREGSGRQSKDQWFHDLMLQGVQRGGRTSAMVEAEGWMLGKKIPKEAIKTFITLFNSTLGDDSLTEHELREEVIPAIDRISGDTEERVVNNLNKRLSLVELESGERVISERFVDHRGVDKIRFAKIMQVRESYIEKEVLINKKPECIFDIWRHNREKRKHYGVIFDPAAAPWEDNGFINLWKGFRLEPRRGDWSLFKAHIETIISKKHSNWIIQWMANIVQNPGGKRPGTVIVLRGDQGTGKGVFANTFGALLGKMEYFFSVTKMSDLTGRFNEDLKTALLLFIDEATWGGDRESAGVLKSLVTEPTRRIEPKGINAFHVDNFLSLIIASNNDWVVPGGSNERRFLCLDVPNDKQQDHGYFKAIGDQMNSPGPGIQVKKGPPPKDYRGVSGDGEGEWNEDEIVTVGKGVTGLQAMYYDLLRVEVDFETISRIPKTKATGDQILKGMDIHEQFWYERLSIGTLVDRHIYWKYLSVNDTLYEQYIEYCQLKNRQIQILGRVQWGMFLNKVCPEIGKKQGYDQESGGRYPCRVFPPLERCRRMFEERYGISSDWPDICEPDNITKKDRMTDVPGPHYKQNYN